MTCNAISLANTPSTLIRLMHEVLKTFIAHFIAVYFYNILIYSRNERDHKQHLRQFFKVLRGRNFTSR